MATYSDQDVAAYIQNLQNTLPADQVEKAIYDAAQQYGVGASQVARSMGGSESDVNSWLANQGLADPATGVIPEMQNQIVQPDPNAFDLQKMIADQLQGAGGTMAGLQNFQMPQINALQAESAMAKATGYNPATIAGTDLSQYMNPYTQEVIDRSLSDIERARMAQANNLGFAATQAGAFGGSRHGVAEALSNEAYAKQAADTAAGLRQQAYNQALTSAGQDVGYQNVANQFTSGATNQANLANAAAQNAMNQFNVNQNMAAQTANQNAALSSAGVQLNAANSGANLANLGFGMQNTVNTNLFNQGLAQQQLNQQLLNNAMTQYTNYVNSPVGALQTLQAGMPGSIPTSQTTSSTPSLFDIFLGAGKTASAFG